jgi:hypothetical protein
MKAIDRARTLPVATSTTRMLAVAGCSLPKMTRRKHRGEAEDSHFAVGEDAGRSPHLAADVDLNPIRAGIVGKLEDSEHTSVKLRLDACANNPNRPTSRCSRSPTSAFSNGCR